MIYDHQNPRTPPFRNQSPNGRMDSAARSTGINTDHQKEVIEAGDSADEKADAPTEALMTNSVDDKFNKTFSTHKHAINVNSAMSSIRVECETADWYGPGDIAAAVRFLEKLAQFSPVGGDAQ